MANQTDLADTVLSSVPYVGAFQEMEPWPTWMGPTQGYLFNRSFMRKVDGLDALSADLRKTTERLFPQIFEA